MSDFLILFFNLKILLIVSKRDVSVDGALALHMTALPSPGLPGFPEHLCGSSPHHHRCDPKPAAKKNKKPNCPQLTVLVFTLLLCCFLKRHRFSDVEEV